MWMPDSDNFINPSSGNYVGFGTVIKCIHTFGNRKTPQLPETDLMESIEFEKVEDYMCTCWTN